jgi:hypothetical protein
MAAAAAAQETLRLEGFAESLRGQRVYCIAGQPKEAETLLRGRLAALDSEVVHRGRRVLIFQGAAGPPKWLVNLTPWDAAFHVRDNQDIKLAITYIQYAAKPCRVVWAGTEPAGQVLGLLSRLEGVSLLGLGTGAPMSPEWSALMWGPSASLEDVEPAVTARMGAGGSTGLRSVLKELRGSDVGLVWSAIGETDKRGGLYWLDPTEGVGPLPLDTREAAETLRAVADMLAGGGR